MMSVCVVWHIASSIYSYVFSDIDRNSQWEGFRDGKGVEGDSMWAGAVPIPTAEYEA